jgi:hypothetical protein
MIQKRNILKIGLICVICLTLLGFDGTPASADPCTPCDTWGLIKCCFIDEVPCKCCSCTKDIEMLYAFYVNYLQSDPDISPFDILEGKYLNSYLMWRMSFSRQTPAGNATWGAIKSLF